MTLDPDWLADLRRYDVASPFLQEQSIWAVWTYRFGRRLDRRAPGLAKRLLTRCYWLLFRLVETVVGVSLPKAATIGPGLRVWHFGGIFLHPDCVIGANCTLRQGVTIGNREEGGPVPVIGDDVDIGAGAKVLGAIRIGNRVLVGANAVVVKDVPDDHVAVGVPAVARPRKSS